MWLASQLAGLTTSLLLFSLSCGSDGTPEATTVEYKAALGTSPQCLEEVNDAREAAGLAKFTAAESAEQKLPDPGEEALPDGEWKNLCTYLIPTQVETLADQSPTNPFNGGTYAFKKLTDEQHSCKETVDYWKAAFKNFTGLPPSKKDAGDLYNSQDNVSFIALYNPSASATADCRVVTCSQTTGVASLSASESPDAGSATAKSSSALLCKTVPTAFANETTAPFTQEQWDKIASSLTGSTSIASPSLVIFGIVAFGITAL
ncbi:SAG family member [Eimeria necatrix]|uniref:SAG family member n=1 Tax=Eimeria necatrix TaxID=51315 RepID=U6MHP5_9EIME|nr:SAG family member [Eimeria necatrix]CDJ62573.1 SAG family member [Eimeria necatrix]